MNNLEKIRKTVAEAAGTGEAEIQLNSSFVALGIDSLEMVNLILELEQELGIDIPEDDYEKLLTVKDVLDYVDSRSVGV